MLDRRMARCGAIGLSRLAASRIAREPHRRTSTDRRRGATRRGVIGVLARPRNHMATSEIVIIDSEEQRRPFFTPRGLALYLALSERTLRELLRTGEIPSYKIAGSRRIDPMDVDAWLAERRHEAA